MLTTSRRIFTPMLFLATMSTILMIRSVAIGDWQYTKWGMSLEEVLSSGGQDIVRTSDEERRRKSIEIIGQALAKGHYSSSEFSSEFKFIAVFLFADQKLRGVYLEPVPMSEGVKAANHLRLMYGKPEKESESWDKQRICFTIERHWRDEGAGNTVGFFDTSCTAAIQGAPKLHFSKILYEPILTKKRTGL